MNNTDWMDWTSQNDARKPAEEPVVKKLNCVLEKILLADFKTQDDTVLSKLFDMIVKKWPATDASPDCPEMATALEIFPNWLVMATISWGVLTPEVRVLTLQIAGHVASTERGFNALVENGVTGNLVSLARSTRLANERGGSRDKFSVTLSFIELIQSFSAHTTGIQFLLKRDLWRDVLDVALSSRSIYALKSAWKCFSSIAFRLMKSNTELAHSIIIEAFTLKYSNGVLLAYGQLNDPKPLNNTGALKNSPENEKEVSLNAIKLAYVLVTTLLDQGVDQGELLSLFQKSQLDKWIWTEMHYGQDEELLSAASKLNSLYNILHIEHFRPGFTSDLKARLMTKLISQHCYLLINRHSFHMILGLCVEYQGLWKKYGGEIVQSENGDMKTFMCSSNECSEDFNYSVADGEYRVQNCLLILQAMPIFLALSCFSTMHVELDIFVDKILHLASPKVLRLGYFYREKIFENKSVTIPCLTHRSILQFIRLAEIGLKKPQALSIFQALNHLMKCFTSSLPLSGTMEWTDKKDNAGDDLLVKHPDILSVTMNCLSRLIEKFDFSPSDCFEATCIMSTLQELLVNPLLSPSLCVDTLKLIKLVLLKFIPPNLALLVNTLQGSSISELGKQLYKTLLKVNWEVQDSALEVIQVISRLAVTEFPAFEVLLIQNDIPSLVLIKAESEQEPYVRASAMVCLKEMVQIDLVWNQSLVHLNILEKTLLSLHYETEGLVRSQAALLVEAMLRCKRIPDSSLDVVFDSMQAVAQSDLHWEVKLSALAFWKTVIEEEFKQEGMIDGHFPDVVFSKEKKKIIQMTPTETNTRVFNAFNKLSSNGCLQVLWDSFHNECDLQVQKTALELTSNLIETAKTFQLVENVCNIPRLAEMDFSSGTKSLPKSPNFNETLFPSNASTPSDDVINDIVAQGDADLLKYIALDGEPPPKILPKIARVRFPPLEFIAKLSSIDLDKVVQVKSVWMMETSEGFESLLDDVLLHCGETSPTNAVDCY